VSRPNSHRLVVGARVKHDRPEAHRLGAAGWFLKISEHDEMVATVLRIARATAA
jgi:hypothetical protein